MGVALKNNYMQLKITIGSSIFNNGIADLNCKFILGNT